METRKIYIAGAVTGLPAFETAQKFKTAETLIKNIRGCDDEYTFEVINPIELVNNPHAEWHFAMKVCLSEMVWADCLVYLPDADQSPGARYEIAQAEMLGIPVYAIDDFIENNYFLKKQVI